MAKRFYIPKAAGVELDLLIDPQEFTLAIDNARLLVVQDLQSLGNAARTEVAICAGAVDLATYDQSLADESDDIQDRLDYYTYADRTQNLTVRDGAWFTPIAVTSFCGETGADVAANMIDGSNSSKWKHGVDETHSLVFELRGYPKKIGKIRWRYNSTEPATERLSNITVRASKALAKIDDVANLLESGINPTWPTGAGSVWVEHVLAQKKNKARFIKIEFETEHSANTAQIREFAVWVETRDP